MEQPPNSRTVLNRRQFLHTAGTFIAGLAWAGETFAQTSPIKIKDVRLGKGVEVEAEDGTIGKFAGSPLQDLKALEPHRSRIDELLVGRNALDLKLTGEMLWEGLLPGKAKQFCEGRDPLTGELVRNKPRGGRHTATGRVFIALSTVDIALWDLRAKLLKKPAYQILGPGRRGQVPVHWRPGEIGIDPSKAARKAREAFDRGYGTQKWYFSKGAADGAEGFKENVELVRALREELPEATLMFDNHSIRYSDDVDWALFVALPWVAVDLRDPHRADSVRPMESRRRHPDHRPGPKNLRRPPRSSALLRATITPMNRLTTITLFLGSLSISSQPFLNGAAFRHRFSPSLAVQQRNFGGPVSLTPQNRGIRSPL